MKIADILSDIDNEALALPVFQRGYVWKRRQVRDLMASLYHGYPVGSLLTWTTRAEQAEVRNDDALRTSGPIDLLLDGQQRVTSLYGIIRGNPPTFFDGDAKAFTDLYFNLESEEFEFYAPVRMRNNPLWISVSGLFASSDDTQWMGQLPDADEYNANLRTYMRRAQKIDEIQNVDLHISRITGDDKTADIVVDIFNRVNSGGTKLSKGDLALARIGAHWPEVRAEMQQRLAKWEIVGFGPNGANLDWLLRCMNAVVNENSEFERLVPEENGIQRIQDALQQTERAVDYLLEATRSHLYMDIDRVYNSKAAFPVMVKYLVDNGGKLANQTDLARLMHWYVSIAIRGRFSGPVETVINQDLTALKEAEPIDALLRNLRQSHGERDVTHEDFDLNYTRARFYPLLYIMTRIHDARDWCTGNRLRHHSLGDHTNLELHHIFPKARLRDAGISPNDANNLGNIAFLTKECNLHIGSKQPAEYMPEVAANWPGVLESQWIPVDRELWKVENYHRFLNARRRLLAEAANEMLATLRAGVIPPAEAAPVDTQLQRTITPIEAGDLDPDDEAVILANANRFAIENGLPAGEMAYEIITEYSGEPITLDLAWPEGLQVGFSQPVALLIDEEDAVLRTVSDEGFRVFTELTAFRRYVERNILAEVV
jgi:hypothetical protein